MATVWVHAANTNILGTPLVKAAAITGVQHRSNRIDAFGVHPGEAVTVAADFGHKDRPLPDHFHLDLLKLIAEQTIAGQPDDHVVIAAETDFAVAWKWNAYPLSNYQWPSED